MSRFGRSCLRRRFTLEATPADVGGAYRPVTSGNAVAAITVSANQDTVVDAPIGAVGLSMAPEPSSGAFDGGRSDRPRPSTPAESGSEVVYPAGIIVAAEEHPLYQRATSHGAEPSEVYIALAEPEMAEDGTEHPMVRYHSRAGASSASPWPEGSDAADQVTVPEGSQEAASRFVQAWLDPDPTTRKAGLEQVSAPALTEELLLTDPANIPLATPRGAPVLDDASAYSVQFTQALSTGMNIGIYLVADPQARYQWLATSVERA